MSYLYKIIMATKNVICNSSRFCLKFNWLDITWIFATFLANSLPASILIIFHFSVILLPMFIFYSVKILRKRWIEVRSQLGSDQGWIKVQIRSSFRYLVTPEHLSITQTVAFRQLYEFIPSRRSIVHIR